MADKNLRISLSVELAGVKEVEEKLRELQNKLANINATYLSKLFKVNKFKIDIPVNLTGVEQAKQTLQSINKKAQRTETAQTNTDGNVNTATQQTGQGFDWKTAIQFSKMKALTPAALMQMTSHITSLSIAFSGLIGVLTAVGVRTAFTTVTKYTRTVSNAMGELKNVILSLTGMDKMFSVQGITNSMIALADVTKEIQKQSLQTGIAVDALSKYRFAMKQVGVSAENFGSNISYMGKAIVQAATGASIDAGNAFKKLKLDPKELRLKDTQTQFEEIAKAIAQLPSETDKASAALLIFNRSGSQLLPFINKFNVGIKQSEGVLGQLPRLMKLYSSEFTQFSNNISNLQIKGQQYIAGFMTQMVPALNNYLQNVLKIDFTDFGKMFADNFQRTVTSLNIHDDIGGLLNSFTLDLMDVVDKALQKTTEYVGDALIKLDWGAITEKILIGTFNFAKTIAVKGMEFFSGEAYDKEIAGQQVKAGETINNFKIELNDNGVENEQEIVDKILEGIELKGVLQRKSPKFAHYPTQIGLQQRSIGTAYGLETLSNEEAKKIQDTFITINNKNNQIKTLFAEYAEVVGKKQAELFKENILRTITEERTKKHVDSQITEYETNPLMRYDTERDVYIKNLEKSIDKIEKDISDRVHVEQFFDKEIQEKIVQEFIKANEQVSNSKTYVRNDASAKLTGAIKDLKDATERLNKEQRDRELENSAYQKSPIHSDTQKAGRASVFIEDSKENLKELLAAYKKEEEVLNETKNVLGTDEEWVSQWDTVTKKIEELTQKIKALEAEGSIARDNETIKNINLQTEKANKEIEQLKNNLAKLKSRPVSGIAGVKAVGEAQKEYVSKLTEEKTNTELNIIRYKAHGFDENSEVVKKATERLEKFNTALEQATNEAEQWAQSVIVEGVQEAVTQRNTELGQFEFEQLPEWAATNKQRYDYQMQVFDAQIQASEDNIEAIRKAQEQMLELDPAVQAVRKAMNELSRDTEDYDEKFAGLLNDLEQARSNSNVRRSAGYRQLEQMRGQEQTKGMMAQSRKQKQENPESFGHQMSKSISNASDQMGTLQENVGQGFGNMIMSVRDSLSTLVSDLLSGTMTIGQAFQKMGQMILQSLISTFGQIVANFVMQQTVMRLLQLMFNAELAAQAAALTTMWTAPATLASIASWGGAAAAGSAAVISALALTKSATAGMSAMAKGGRIKGKEQIIRVNEEGEEFIVSAKSPLANEKYLKLANLGYNLDSLFANQSMKEVNASASKLNIINNNKTERPQTNNNINIGMINSRQDKRRWMRKEGQRMIVDFLNGHRGALKYA